MTIVQTACKLNGCFVKEGVSSFRLLDQGIGMVTTADPVGLALGVCGGAAAIKPHASRTIVTDELMPLAGAPGRFYTCPQK